MINITVVLLHGKLFYDIKLCAKIIKEISKISRDIINVLIVMQIFIRLIPKFLTGKNIEFNVLYLLKLKFQEFNQ